MSRKWWFSISIGVALLVIVGIFALRFWLDSDLTVHKETPPPVDSVSPTPYELDETDPNGRTILFSGDSLSDGFFASTQPKGFVSLVEREFASSGASEFVHTHKHGYRLQDVVRGFAVPSGVDLAIVELGTNDVGRKTLPATFAAQYGAYLDAIAASSPGVEFVCLGVFSPINSASTAIDVAIESACTQHQGTFVDIQDIYAEPAMRGPRGVSTWAGKSDSGHPNDSGHALISSRVLEAIANS